MKKKKRKQSDYFIILLAYIHRYVFPVSILGLSALFGKTKNGVMLCMGIGCFLYAVYTFLGYKLRWSHIFCSYQNAGYQKMTPGYTHWDTIDKKDAYGVPIIFAIMGIACILISVFCD